MSFQLRFLKIHLIQERGRCEKCGNKFNLTIHHKKESSKGGYDAIDNLQVLCRECHDKIHKIQPKNKKFK